MDKKLASLQKALQKYLDACDNLENVSQDTFNNADSVEEKNFCLSSNSIVTNNYPNIQIAKDILRQIDVMSL